MKSQNDATQSVTGDHNLILKKLAKLLNEALPLAQRVESEEFTSEEREQLRTLTLTPDGRSQAVFALSNVLFRLCGESSRRLLSEDPKDRAAEKRRLKGLANRSLSVANRTMTESIS